MGIDEIVYVRRLHRAEPGDQAAHLLRIGYVAVLEELDAPRRGVVARKNPHEGRVHPVERGSGHETDDEMLALVGVVGYRAQASFLVLNNSHHPHLPPCRPQSSVGNQNSIWHLISPCNVKRKIIFRSIKPSYRTRP